MRRGCGAEAGITRDGRAEGGASGSIGFVMEAAEAVVRHGVSDNRKHKCREMHLEKAQSVSETSCEEGHDGPTAGVAYLK